MYYVKPSELPKTCCTNTLSLTFTFRIEQVRFIIDVLNHNESSNHMCRVMHRLIKGELRFFTH